MNDAPQKIKVWFESRKEAILIVILGVLLFVPYLGNVQLFDWDELNFAEAAREMLVTGDYSVVQIDFRPFHEKPPLFIWMQAASMSIFGINEFAARFPNAIIGIITLLILFNIGKNYRDKKFGLLWVTAYAGSILPNFYFKTGLIDPTFNLFIFIGIYYSEKFHFNLFENKSDFKLNNKFLFLSGLFTALAVMTKGPVGWLLPALCWISIWFINRKLYKFPIRNFIIYSLISFLPALIWYLYLAFITGGSLAADFLEYQIRLFSTNDAGHSGPIYYHFVILLIGCFPASIVALRGFRKNIEDTAKEKSFKYWNIVLLSVVLGVFSIVNTKIIHYSSLAYFPISFVAAYAMHSIIYKNLKWKTSTAWLILIFGTFISIIIIIILYLFINFDILQSYIKDETVREILKINVGWIGYEYAPAVVYLILIIISFILFLKKKLLNGFLLTFTATALFLYSMLPIILPKFEIYLQGAAVEFYKNHRGQECYIHIFDIGNYKYGHLFYSEKPMGLLDYQKSKSENKSVEEWLLTGKIDHPAYFVGLSKNTEKYLKNPELKLLYTKNGVVFLMIEAQY